jgi:tetratricopeptide (TPR) repeat protein
LSIALAAKARRFSGGMLSVHQGRFRSWFIACLIASCSAQDTEWESNVSQARLLAERGDFVRAQRYFRIALAHAERFGAHDPRLPATLTNLGSIAYELGNYRDAERWLRRSIAEWESVAGVDDPQMAAPLNNLAAVYTAKRRYRQAQTLYRRSLDILIRAGGLKTPAAGSTLNNLAGVHGALNEYSEAERLYRQALALQEPQSDGAAAALHNLAIVCWRTGRREEAEGLLQQSLNISERTGHRSAAAKTRVQLGLLYTAAGKFGEAEPLFRHAIRTIDDSVNATPPVLDNALRGYAVLLHKTGRKQEAREMEERARVASARSASEISTERHTIDVRELKRN